MPSETSKLPAGSSSRLQRLAAMIRRSPRDRDPGAVAARLVQPHDEVAGPVVGELDGVDLDAVAGDVTTGAGYRRRRAVGDHAHRQVETLGLGDHAGEAGPVREQADRDVVAPLVRVGVRVAGGTGEADPHGAVEQGVAVAPVVEHGDAERGLGDVDVAVRADLELGRVPRRRRRGSGA